MGFDKVKYDAQYRRDHYDHVTFDVIKGGKDVLRQLAKEHTGGNVSALIVDALRQVYGVTLRD